MNSFTAIKPGTIKITNKMYSDISDGISVNSLEEAALVLFLPDPALENFL